MSVSAGTGGVSVVGAVVGAGSGVKGASALPYTGAGHMAELVALGLVLLIAGILMLGLVRRVSDGESPSP